MSPSSPPLPLLPPSAASQSHKRPPRANAQSDAQRSQAHDARKRDAAKALKRMRKVKKVKKNPAAIPNRRTDDVLDKQARIRQHFNLLVDFQPFDPERVVHEEEASDFEERWQRRLPHSTFQSCDIDNFRIFLRHTPQCAWNKSAAEVFARDFVHTLQRDYKAYQLTDQQKWEAEQVNRRNGRKAAVFGRRLFVVEGHPMLKDFAKDMESLGSDAMSDDESDSEDANIPIRVNGKKRPGRRTFTYHVKKPKWRSNTLSVILHTLDTLYPIVKNILGYGRRGALPRLRIHNNDSWSDESELPRTLASSAYDHEWLMSIPPDANLITPSPETLRLAEFSEVLLGLVGVKAK